MTNLAILSQCANLFLAVITLIVAFTWQRGKVKWLFCAFVLLHSVNLLLPLVPTDAAMSEWPLSIRLIVAPVEIVFFHLSGLLLLWFAVASHKLGESVAPSAHEDSGPDMDTSPEGGEVELAGITGWLILPAIGLVLSAISLLVGIVLSGYAFDAASQTVSGNYRGLSIFVGVFMLVFVLIVSVLFFAKRRSAPLATIALMGTGVTASLVLTSIAVGADQEELAVESGIALFLNVVGSAIWIPYFSLSKRVKATFVR